jgi:integrase
MRDDRFALMDGKLHVYRRGGRHWHCSTFIDGKNHRVSTKEENLAFAKEFAEDWYCVQRMRSRRARLKGLYEALAPLAETQTSAQLAQSSKPKKPSGPSFKEVAQKFLDEFEIITDGQRNARYAKGHRDRVRMYLEPFFGEKAITEVTAGLIQEYRIKRIKDAREKNGKPPGRSTLHQEMVCLRQILKTANRHGWIAALPDMSSPYKGSSKISHRGWFSPEEYKRFYEASRERAKNPKKERWRTASENMHDYILLMVNTGLRPDEVLRLEYRDVAIVTDDATGERILEIEVRGKRGVGFCKSMPGAVMPFRRLKERNNGQPTDRLFPKFQRELFNALLEDTDLRKDRDGNPRTAYSLRHTYICLRLMEGADIYQIAKNCRTSVEMIEKYYASHIKNTLDAAAINVRKAPPKKPKKNRNDAARAP